MNHLVATILRIAGIITAGAFAVLDQAPLLTDALIGAGAGVLVGKLLVYRLERRGREMSAPRVRQVEWAWTIVGVTLAITVHLRVEGLP